MRTQPVGEMAIALLLLSSCGGEAAPEQGETFALPPLPEAGADECVVEVRHDGEFKRASVRLEAAQSLRVETNGVTTMGLQPSIFFHALDAQDRLLEVGQRVAGKVTWRRHYERDEHGSEIVAVYESNGEVSGRIERRNFYDASGRLERAEWWNGTGGLDFKSGTQEQYRHDTAGRLIRIETTQPGVSGDATQNHYDATGRLESVERFSGGRIWLRTSYRYDAKGRLAKALNDGYQGYFGVDGVLDHVTRWRYDEAGRVRAAHAEGQLSDVVGGPVSIGYSPGCEPLRARFPRLFRQPEGPQIEPRL